jgi:hypothetical protein
MNQNRDTNVLVTAEYPQVGDPVILARSGSMGYAPRNLFTAKYPHRDHPDAAIWRQPVAKLARQPSGTAISTNNVGMLRQLYSASFDARLLGQIVQEMRWGGSLDPLQQNSYSA